MNKFYRLLSVVTLTLSVALWSCKGDQGPQGPAGPQGNPGPTGGTGPVGPTGPSGATGITGATGQSGKDGKDGKDGNANVKGGEVIVKTTDWKTIDAAGAGTGNTGLVGAFDKVDANITATSGIIAEVKIGSQRVALPRLLFKETEGSTEQIGFAYETGKITFYYSLKTANGTMIFKPQTDLTFSYTIIEKTLLVNMKAEGVDINSREAVDSYLQSHQF